MFTQKDREYISRIGFGDHIDRIEKAYDRKHTKYRAENYAGMKGECSIFREEAISLLGREKYLEGLALSAIYGSAKMQNKALESVHFTTPDYHNL